MKNSNHRRAIIANTQFDMAVQLRERMLKQKEDQQVPVGNLAPGLGYGFGLFICFVSLCIGFGIGYSSK